MLESHRREEESERKEGSNERNVRVATQRRGRQTNGRVEMKGRDTRTGCQKIETSYDKNEAGNGRQNEEVPMEMKAFK